MYITYHTPKEQDLSELMVIERLGFTPEEAATESAMKERIQFIADSFIIAKNKQGKITGYVVGPVISTRYLTDDLFEKTNLNPKEGGFQSVLSLVVHPDYRGQGIARKLLKELEAVCVNRKREGITLTCLEELVPFYEENGYYNEGKSNSTHAGEVWFNLVKEML
ncbi:MULTISPECIES: GNAT family N-acetyltransferase [Bacillaceae]|uniref:GNAT family N-acetyltransferase n=1 Tax=Bacillaceae TaxID=186817 RepID=UPI001046D2DE|nr:GNAT family N-acetyltransferase [Bacillus sp. CBEL-1]TDB55056.1 GNAT family N-acetyltransferase [Bacillus sp. CBEL-1]